jgi:protein TonB
MFDSVLEQNIPRRRLGRGALMSFGVHAFFLALAIYVGSRPKVEEPKTRAVTFFNPPPPPPPPPPPAGGGAVKSQPKKPTPTKKPNTVVQTKEQKIEKPVEAPKSSDPEPAGQAGGVVGGVAGGVVGGTVGGVVGGQIGGVVGGTGTDIIPFGAGMVRPTVVKPGDLVWSKEALAMRIGGVVLANCTINLDGTLSDCTVTKSLPYMDKQIAEMLRTMKYTPVMYQGHPQRVKMVVTIRVPSPG